jgi:hypothetical protein
MQEFRQDRPRHPRHRQDMDFLYLLSLLCRQQILVLVFQRHQQYLLYWLLHHHRLNLLRL